MDTSTTGFTLLTGFVFDVLTEYKHIKRLCEPVFEMAADLDPNAPNAVCSIEIYNKICDWIEKNVGGASIRDAGRSIGQRAYDAMVSAGKLTDPTPKAIMTSLQWAATTLIQDPRGRGWELRESSANSLVMRRTQTFNCLLQEGLLLSLIERTNVLMPAVAHRTCTRHGDAFCEYQLTWLARKNSTVSRARFL